MKTLLVLSAFVSLSATAGTVVSKKNVVLPVDISTTKLKLSRADYSSPVVKVLIPMLADVTLLNHRNTSEGAPCMATYETRDPDAVIQNDPRVENIPFTVTLTKETYADEQNKICKVSLTETIDGKIRGFNFTHRQFAALPDRHIDDCR